LRGTKVKGGGKNTIRYNVMQVLQSERWGRGKRTGRHDLVILSSKRKKLSGREKEKGGGEGEITIL